MLCAVALAVAAQSELLLLPGDPGFSGDVEVVDLDASANATCALTSGNDITCWGQNRFAPILARGFVDVAAGSTFTCGLKSDGTVQCFGSDRFSAGQTTPPTDEQGEPILFSEIDSYENHLCGIGLDNGRVVCWGDDNDGQSSGIFDEDLHDEYLHKGYDYSEDEFSYIRAGRAHSCGVLKGGAGAGSIRCWGYNEFNESTVPAAYASATFKAVEAGRNFTCGLLAEGEDAGKAVCWGDDLYKTVSEVPEMERFDDISANEDHVCGVTTDGHARCWGGKDNPSEPLKVDYGQASVPTQHQNATFTKLIAAKYHTCGVLDGRNDQTAGEVVCWGAEFDHDFTSPHLVDGGRADPVNYRYPALSADPKVGTGWYYNCGLTAARDIVCWGGGSTKRTFTEGPFIDLSVGWDHTCGVRETGHVMCWGRNNNLQSRGWSDATLSPDLEADSALVENLTTDYTFKAVSASDYHTCGILDGRTEDQTSGAVLCWGHNADGQATPPSSTFKQISTGLYHGCGLLDGQNGQLENRIECWGATNQDTTIARDTTSDYGQADIPSELEGVEFLSVSAGVYHTCGVRKDTGAVACWGFSEIAEVPDDLRGQRYTSVNAWRFSTCGITEEKRVKCWGPSEITWPGTEFAVVAYNLNQHRVPEAYLEAEFERVSVSARHVCATNADGKVLCWGADAIPSTSELDVFVGKRIINTGQAWVPRSFRAIPPTPTPTPTATPTFTPTPVPETPVPTPTFTPTPIPLPLARILRIEPAIRSVTLTVNEEVRLAAQVYGRQDIRDDSLGDDPGVTFEWTAEDRAGESEPGQGEFAESVSSVYGREKNSLPDDRRVLYTAPAEPGRYRVRAALDVGTSECLGRRDGETEEDAIERCTAIFDITVMLPSPDEPTPVPPRNPAGEMPEVIVDEDGTNYEVFTPQDGGEFVIERCTFKIPKGAINDMEVIGVSVTELEEPEDQIYVDDPRFMTDGIQCRISAVDVHGAPLIDYQLLAPGEICMPLPDEFRPNGVDALVGAINPDATLTALSSKIYLAGRTGALQVCGSISTLSATAVVALRAEVAGELLPTPVPTADVADIDTGASRLSQSRAAALTLLGIVLAALAVAIMINRNRRKSDFLR